MFECVCDDDALPAITVNNCNYFNINFKNNVWEFYRLPIYIYQNPLRGQNKTQG